MGHEQISVKKGADSTQPCCFKRGPGTIVAPQSPIVQHYRDIGNDAVQRLIEAGEIQAKLTIGQPNDKYEQEADRVAEQVMRMPEPEGSSVNGHWSLGKGEKESPLIQRQSEECPECNEKEEDEEVQVKPIAEQITPLVQRQVENEEEEEEETAQAKSLSNKSPQMPPGLQGQIQSMKGGGQPLTPSTRSFFEPRFGADFSGVRVHNDEKAASLARSVNARAFTHGCNVVFGAGEYSSDRLSSKQLLAHELTHVVQQNSGATLFPRGKYSENTVPNPQESSIVSPNLLELCPGLPGEKVKLQPISPLIQCQKGKGMSKDKLELARVKNVKLTVSPGNVNRGRKNGIVFVNGVIFAEASAEVAPGLTPTKNFAFGFIQVCRPYEIVRATYLKRGAAAGTGNDLDWNASSHIRNKLPAIDAESKAAFYHVIPEKLKTVKKRGVWDYMGKTIETVTPTKGKVPPVTIYDKPRQTFLESKIKGNSIYDITGFSWQSHFFTAYVVKLPSGKIEPLATFFWRAEDCLASGAMNIKAQPMVVGKVTNTQVRYCSNKHHCDRGEPGFNKAGTKPKASQTCQGLSFGAQKKTPYKGPDDFKIKC